MSSGLEVKDFLFIGYPSRGELLAAAIVLPLVALVAISLRYFVRISHKTPFGIDDWLLIPALLALTGVGACIITGVVKKSVGYPTPPTDSNSPEALNPIEALSEKLDFAITLLTIIAYGFIKLSIVFLYRRIFVVPQHSNIFNITTLFLIAIIISWTITFIFLFVFDCGTHVSAQWGSPEQLALYCGAGLKHEEALYMSEFLTNVLLAIAPIPSILSLRLTSVVKAQIIGIFLLAFSAFACSIIRLILVFEIVNNVTFGSNFDLNQTNSTVFYWNMIEAGIALIVCCLPTLKPLISDKGIGSAIASIRTAISLRSTRSNYSQNSRIPTEFSNATGNYRKMERERPIPMSLKGRDVELKNNGSTAVSVEYIV